MRDSRIPWALALLVALPATMAAADRAARFREYDARRMAALRKMAEASSLEGATARLHLNKDVDQANRIAMEADFPKIYWANNVSLIPLYEMFNADTGTRAKLLSREATDKILAYLWQCFQPEGKAGGHIARHYHFLPDQPWLYWGNQNHGFVYQSLFYRAATALKDIPKYASQFDPARHVPLAGGVDDLKGHPELAKITLADYAARARDMWRNRLLWMAQQGLWAEDMIYRLSNVEGTYNLAYHDGDPVIRKRAEMILDLHWLLYALQTVEEQSGGAQNRFKPHYVGYHPERGTGWFYFGGRPGTQPCVAALLGDYVPPEIVYQLLQNQDKRGCFIHREPGGAEIKPAAIEQGWLFGQAGDAWLALRPAQGQCTINAEKKQFEWPEWKMPLVLHTGGATEDGSFENFKKKVLSNRLAYEDGTLTYADAKWGTMQFCPDPARPAGQWRRVDGKPVPLPDRLFDSPYMASDYNSGVVTAQFNGHKLVLDFHKAERTEALPQAILR